MNNKKISKKLMQLRGKQRRDEVASAIGISTSALVMYERGERVPRDDIKIKLANYYGVSVDYIFFT